MGVERPGILAVRDIVKYVLRSSTKPEILETRGLCKSVRVCVCVYVFVRMRISACACVRKCVCVSVSV